MRRSQRPMRARAAQQPLLRLGRNTSDPPSFSPTRGTKRDWSPVVSLVRSNAGIRPRAAPSRVYFPRAPNSKRLPKTNEIARDSFQSPQSLSDCTHSSNQMHFDCGPAETGDRLDFGRVLLFHEVQQKDRTLPLRQTPHDTPDGRDPLLRCKLFFRRHIVVRNPIAHGTQGHRRYLRPLPELPPAVTRDVTHQVDSDPHKPGMHAQIATKLSGALLSSESP